MSVCHFFLQGRCRFGANCRFKHCYTNDDRNPRSPDNSEQLTNVVKQIVEEVILSEKGGQWPLSCFSPIKEGPNIPGWEDISPEEVRWKMYEARANGTLNQCNLEISQWYSNAEKMRNLIKEPTMERVNLIVNVLKGKRESSNTSSQFNSAPSSASIFGGSAQSAGNQNNFRSITQNTGSHGSIFGSSSPPSGNVFGGSSQPENVFGTSQGFPNQSIFGGTSTPAGFFQNPFPNPQTSNQNRFSNSPSTGSGNIFSSGTVSSQNIFSKPGEGNSQNAFSSANSSAIFSNQSSSAPLFGSNNTFFHKAENQNQNQTNVFGAGQNENIFKTTQNAFAKTNDVFNTQQEPGKSNFGVVFGQQKSKEFDSSVYSKLEDLNEDEVKSFTSATFAFGRIPLKPPLKEYCK